MQTRLAAHLLATVALLFAVAPCRLAQAQDSARHGMVSTAHPLATDAGVRILAQGGTALDAAVAVAATLNVVEPMMSGVGGYGTILIYDAQSRRARFLNPSGRMPATLDSDMFRAPTPDYRSNRRGDPRGEGTARGM
jgi:gamma-glutamyltranspeptidase/glutathione hydrolase